MYIYIKIEKAGESEPIQVADENPPSFRAVLDEFVQQHFKEQTANDFVLIHNGVPVNLESLVTSEYENKGFELLKRHVDVPMPDAQPMQVNS
jgi:hypothetical protein